MIGSNYIFNGQAIENETSEYGIFLDDTLNPRDLNFSDQSENIQGYHGINTSPTYARGRVIGITGHIMSKTDDPKVGFGKGMNYLDNLFKLQGNPAQLETKVFKFTDDEGNDWEGNTKVKNPLKYELFETDTFHFLRKFIVILIAPNPLLLSPIEESKNGEEGFVGGVAITESGIAITESGIALNEPSGTFIITPSGGNQPLQPRFEITALKDVNKFLKIKNITSGNYIQFNSPGVAGDIYIINSLDQTATQNGVNIMATKVGGNFITIDGTTELEIFDVDGRYLGNDLDITVYYKNILL